MQLEENNKIKNGAENIKPNVGQLGGNEYDNMPKIVEGIVGDILTHGNLAFLQGSARIAIFCSANFPQVFLRKNLGSNSHSAVFAVINVLGLQILIAFMQAANMTTMLTGASYNYGDFVLFVKLYSIAAIIQSGLIYYRLKFQPERIVYSYSFGESLLYPFYTKISKIIGFKFLQSQAQFQYYIEPTLVCCFGFFLSAFMGYSLGTFIMFCGVAMFLQIAEQRKNLRKEIERFRDANIIASVLLSVAQHSEKDGHEIRKDGFAISKTEINTIKQSYSQKPIDSTIQSLINEQSLE
jgi:hypothetical protein